MWIDPKVVPGIIVLTEILLIVYGLLILLTIITSMLDLIKKWRKP